MNEPCQSHQSADEAFALDGVTVRYGALAALDRASLAIPTGATVALVGPSGSGKTTLLRLLNAAVRATEGEVRAFGTDISRLRGKALRSLRSSIAIIPQDLSLIPNVRVIQNVVSGRFGRRSLAGALRDFLFPTESDTADAHATLERVGIGDKLFHRTDTLSGGQQQRVAIARALFQRPEAILADEPVSSVDPARAKDTVELLTRLAREEGVTLCMSLHNLELARACFPRLVGLRRGSIVFDASPETIDDAAVSALYHLDRNEILDDGRPDR